MRNKDRTSDYTLIPTERDANYAAGAYARARLGDELNALAVDDFHRRFVEQHEPVANLLDETVEFLWNYVEPDEGDDEDTARRTNQVVVAEAQDAASAWIPAQPQHRVRRGTSQPFVVEVDG
jgi:hypothetical protein